MNYLANPPESPERLTLREWYRLLRGIGTPASEAIAEARTMLGLTAPQLRARWMAMLDEVLAHTVSARLYRKRPPEPDRTATPIFSMMTAKRSRVVV